MAIRGGVEAFLAQDADNSEVPAYAEIVIVDYRPPRLVIVSPLTEESLG